MHPTVCTPSFDVSVPRAVPPFAHYTWRGSGPQSPATQTRIASPLPPFSTPTETPPPPPRPRLGKIPIPNGRDTHTPTPRPPRARERSRSTATVSASRFPARGHGTAGLSRRRLRSSQEERHSQLRLLRLFDAFILLAAAAAASATGVP